MSLRVIYEEKAINQAARFLADDRADKGLGTMRPEISAKRVQPRYGGNRQ